MKRIPLGGVLFIVLFLPHVAAEGGQGEPAGPAILVEDEIVGPGKPVHLRLDDVTRYLGENRIANGDFALGIEGWTFGGSGEVGSGAYAEARTDADSGRKGTIVVGAREATKTGTVYIHQQVNFPAGAGAELRYLARDVGESPTEIRLIIREKDATGKNVDTSITHKISRNWSAFTWSWTPTTNSGSATIYLRVYAPAKTEAGVEFDDVEFRRAPDVTWRATSGQIIRAVGTRATILFAAPGTYDVTNVGQVEGRPVWETSITIAVENHPPTARLRPSSNRFVTSAPVEFEASLTSDIDQANQLADPAFRELGSVWIARATETSPSSFDARPVERPDSTRGLRLTVGGTSKAGSVYVFQRMPLQQPGPFVLTFDALDDGNISSYAILFREYAGTTKADTTVVLPSTKGRAQVISAEWKPKLEGATELDVFLRFMVPAQSSAYVEMMNPRLHAGLTYEWQIDQGKTKTTSLPLFSTYVRTLGPHTVRLTVRDAHGGVDESSLAFDVHSPVLQGRLETPALVPTGLPVTFDAAGVVREGRDNVLSNPSFAEGGGPWRFSSMEVGDNGSYLQVTEQGNTFARLSASSSRKGAIWIQQDTTPLCAEVACDYGFRYRTNNSELSPAIILRSRIPPQNADQNWTTADTTFRLPPSIEWRSFRAIFSDPSPSTALLSVYVRAEMAANTSASIDFDDVFLQPQLQSSWRVEGTKSDEVDGGRTVSRTFTEAGLFHASITLTDPWDVSQNRTVAIRVVPVLVYRAATGGIGIRYDPRFLDPAENLTFSVENSDGSLVLRNLLDPEQDIANKTIRVERSQRGFEHLVLIREEGDFQQRSAVLVLSNQSASSRLPVTWLVDPEQVAATYRSDLVTSFVGPFGVFKVQFGSDDPSIKDVNVRVVGDGKRIAEAELAGENGRFSADLRLPLTFREGTYRLEYAITTVHGDRVEFVKNEQLELMPRNSLTGAVGTVGLGIAALGVGAYARGKTLRTKDSSPTVVKGRKPWPSTPLSSTSPSLSSSSSAEVSSGRKTANSRSGLSAPTASRASSSASSSSTSRASDTK